MPKIDMFYIILSLCLGVMCFAGIAGFICCKKAKNIDRAGRLITYSLVALAILTIFGVSGGFDIRF